MGKSKGSTTQTTAPDAQTQQYSKQVWDAANNAAVAGTPVNQNTLDAAHNFGGFAAAGNLGLGALSGNPALAAMFMNPYQSQVMDQMRQQYGIQRQGVANQINDEATQAGAFGGSRHGVAEGVAQAQLGRDQNQQMAGLLQGGYSDAMGRAGTLANLGFGANGALGSMGEYMRNVDVQNDPAMRKMQFLQSAFGAMPHGSTTTTTQENGTNWLSGLLGIGMTAGGLGWAPFAAKGGAAGGGLSPFVNLGIGGF